MSQPASYVKTSWPEQWILEIVPADLRARGKGGGEKGESGEISQRKWVLDVKQNSIHLPVHWLYFSTMNPSTQAPFKVPHKGRSSLTPSKTLRVQIWNQLFIKSKLAATYLYGVIWEIQKGPFAPKFLRFQLDIGPEILTIITLPLIYIILWKVSGKMQIFVLMLSPDCQTILLHSCLEILFFFYRDWGFPKSPGLVLWLGLWIPTLTQESMHVVKYAAL